MGHTNDAENFGALIDNAQLCITTSRAIMGTLTRFDLSRLKQEGVNVLYETGTGHGRSLEWAHRCGIENITSIEEDASVWETAKKNLQHIPSIKLLRGKSLEMLHATPASAPEPRLFFLDAHFLGGADFKGQHSA